MYVGTARINFERVSLSGRNPAPKTMCIVRFHRLSGAQAAAPWEQRQISGCRGLGEEVLGVPARGYRVSFWDVEKSLELDRGGGYNSVCVCAKGHGAVHF